MRKLRDILYIKAYPESNVADIYGLEFHEFIKYAPLEPKQLMLLKTGYPRSELDQHTGFEIVIESGIADLLKEDIYHYGNFCWVDFSSIEDMQKLTNTQIAELLYLEHVFKPISSPFFEEINNRYAYMSHDDGWHLRLFMRNYDDLKEIIANKVAGMVSALKRTKDYPFPETVKEKLAALAPDGLLIDFGYISRYKGTISISIYTIGEFDNMDVMYREHQKHICHPKYHAYLKQKNKTWRICDESSLA